MNYLAPEVKSTYLFIFLYMNTSAVETPDYKRGCFAGYYFIAHTRKKVILLPELPLQIRDRLDRAQPVCIGETPLPGWAESIG